MKPEREKINQCVARLKQSDRGTAALKQLKKLLAQEYVPVGLDEENVYAYTALIQFACLGWYDSVKDAITCGKCDDPTETL